MAQYWSDLHGVTHLTERHFKNWTMTNFLPPSDSLFLDIFRPAANVQLRDTPPGWRGPWHRDKVPQLVFFIAGQRLWRFMDRTAHRFSPGDVYFGNDQNSTDGFFFCVLDFWTHS